VIRIDLSLRNLLTIAGMVIGIWLLAKVWSVVVLAGVGLLIAAALMPYVDWLWRRTHNRALAVVIIVFTVLAAIAGIFVIVLPPMISQSQALWDKAPELQERAATFSAERGWVDIEARIRQFEPKTLFDSAQVVNTGRLVIGVIVALFTTFFLSAYFLLDARRLKQFLYFSTPKPWHIHIRNLLPALQRVVGGYIRGQAITSGAIFLFTFIMLTVLRVPNALALSAIAAIADLIPLVGVYILIAPIAIVALTQSVTTAAIAIGLIVLYQQFEDRILIPRVYGATLRLPTIAVVLAILIGAELLGLVGALVEYFSEVRHHSAETAAAGTGATDQLFAPQMPQDAAAKRADEASPRAGHAQTPA
jgi:predicted PurR-regulated permease PerM